MSQSELHTIQCPNFQCGEAISGLDELCWSATGTAEVVCKNCGTKVLLSRSVYYYAGLKEDDDG